MQRELEMPSPGRIPTVEPPQFWSAVLLLCCRLWNQQVDLLFGSAQGSGFKEPNATFTHIPVTPEHEPMTAADYRNHPSCGLFLRMIYICIHIYRYVLRHIEMVRIVAKTVVCCFKTMESLSELWVARRSTRRSAGTRALPRHTPVLGHSILDTRAALRLDIGFCVGIIIWSYLKAPYMYMYNVYIYIHLHIYIYVYIKGPCRFMLARCFCRSSHIALEFLTTSNHQLESNHCRGHTNNFNVVIPYSS